ncbi:MAG TPA: hypothetical protein VHL11_01250 [Phototrophicaceae bacterium]|nr:hypothetical protein [Phototrophicaceae bacterium]
MMALAGCDTAQLESKLLTFIVPLFFTDSQNLITVYIPPPHSATSPNSSEAAAKGFMDAFAALDADKMKVYLCSAQAAAADGLAVGLSQAGTDVNLDASGLTYTAEESDGTATVTITGKLKIEIAEQSVDTDITALFPDGKLPMIKEDGRWKVCPPS